MATPETGRIGEQHDAYRKGLVLGLTMAEVGILIIFVLLLLIAFEALEHERGAREFRGKTAVVPERLQQLESEEQTLKTIAGELGVDVELRDELARRLVRIIQAIASAGRGQSALVEAKEEIEKLKATRGALEKVLADVKSKGAKGVAQQLEEQGFKIGNQEGQLRHYEKRLAEVGQGKGERPCWVRPDGKIEYLYDVVLTSNGIRMREYMLPDRAAARTRYPMPAIDAGETLTPGEFLRRTYPLYRSSLAENCRFFVVIYDGTGAQEKVLYKSLLKTVESHFYKSLDSGPAPF
jgi:hypothetical protein